MKHITPDRLETLSELLTALNCLPGIKEKKRGIYYQKGRAFLHFHEHTDENGEQIYADVRLQGDDFERYICTGKANQQKLLRLIKAHLSV